MLKNAEKIDFFLGADVRWPRYALPPPNWGRRLWTAPNV